MIRKVKTIAISLGLVGMIISCKGQTKENNTAEIIDETVETELPNLSDALFSDVFDALESNDNKLAASNLKKAINALMDEGSITFTESFDFWSTEGIEDYDDFIVFENTDLQEKSNKRLQGALKSLNTIYSRLKKDKTISTDELRNAIANAELSTKHDYLITDDIYVLETPKVSKEKALMNAFKRNMDNLKATDKELKNDTDNSGKTLYKEATQLEKEYKDWLKKVQKHVEKTNEHFKKYHPQHYFPLYLP